MRTSATTMALLVGTVMATAPLAAQASRVELSPFGGYRWGGTIEASDNAVFGEDVDVDASGVYGLRLEVALNEVVRFELFASRQDTTLSAGDDELFGDDRRVADVKLDTVQVGMLFQGGDGQVHPYGVIGIGRTELDPELPGVSSDDRLSASAGGGVKVELGPHVGLRFEGRLLWTDTADGDRRHRDRSHDDWEDDEDDDWDWDEDLYQGEATVGLIFAF